MSARPLILLSNDDGYTAPGLLALRDALGEWAEVVVCAPELNQSATSHSLSLHRVLRLRQAEPRLFVVDGTPADCVYVALNAGERVLGRAPDLCVSGMNHGLNLGVDVFYSGTVAAAREAALRRVPSLAVSADSRADRAAAAALGARIAREVLEAARARAEGGGLLLNVNVPPGSAWSTRATRLGRRNYAGDVIFRHDPRGGEYMWIGGGEVTHHESPGSDTEAYDEGVVGITPLSLSLDEPRGMGLAERVAAGLSAG